MTTAKGSIIVRQAPKDGISIKGDTGLTGLSIRQTEWAEGFEYRNDSNLTTSPRYMDIVVVLSTSGLYTDAAGQKYTLYQAKAAHNGVTSAASNKPGSGANWQTYWDQLNQLKPIYTPLLLAQLIKAQQIDVANLIVEKIAMPFIFSSTLDLNNSCLALSPGAYNLPEAVPKDGIFCAISNPGIFIGNVILNGYFNYRGNQNYTQLKLSVRQMVYLQCKNEEIVIEGSSYPVWYMINSSDFHVVNNIIEMKQPEL